MLTRSMAIVLLARNHNQALGPYLMGSDIRCCEANQHGMEFCDGLSLAWLGLLQTSSTQRWIETCWVLLTKQTNFVMKIEETSETKKKTR
jgi:hypothetical protein